MLFPALTAIIQCCLYNLDIAASHVTNCMLPPFGYRILRLLAPTTKFSSIFISNTFHGLSAKRVIAIRVRNKHAIILSSRVFNSKSQSLLSADTNRAPNIALYIATCEGDAYHTTECNKVCREYQLTKHEREHTFVAFILHSVAVS